MEINKTSGAPETTVIDMDIAVNREASRPDPVEKDSFVRMEKTPVQADQDQKEQKELLFEKKDPTMSSIDAAFSSANSKLAKTRCEYSYDEDMKRVSIKVYDKESDELIREVPPEKSLEMLQKIWELAGIMVDEKR